MVVGPQNNQPPLSPTHREERADADYGPCELCSVSEMWLRAGKLHERPAGAGAGGGPGEVAKVLQLALNGDGRRASGV